MNNNKNFGQSGSCTGPHSASPPAPFFARKEKVLKGFVDVGSFRIVPSNFTATCSLSTSARETFCTRKLLACPERSMSKHNASKLVTRTLFCFNLGIKMYSVLMGLAVLWLKVMRLTTRSAFMARNVFSLCVRRRFSDTDIVITQLYFFRIKKSIEMYILQWQKVAALIWTMKIQTMIQTL